MRTTINTNAVVNIADRSDVIRIAGFVALNLHQLGQQLLCTAGFAKPAAHPRAAHLMASYWSECSLCLSSSESMPGGGRRPSGQPSPGYLACLSPTS